MSVLTLIEADAQLSITYDNIYCVSISVNKKINVFNCSTYPPAPRVICKSLNHFILENILVNILFCVSF